MRYYGSKGDKKGEPPVLYCKLSESRLEDSPHLWAVFALICGRNGRENVDTLRRRQGAEPLRPHQGPKLAERRAELPHSEVVYPPAGGTAVRDRRALFGEVSPKQAGSRSFRDNGGRRVIETETTKRAAVKAQLPALHRPIAQLAEHPAYIRAVLGSSPSGPTTETGRRNDAVSDRFYTGQRKRTKGGTLDVACKGAPDIVKKLRKLEHGGEVAIQRTVSDFNTRAPAWVAQGIREHYGVDKAAINEAGPKKKKGSTVKAAGVTVDGATLVYNGRTLTPIHFKMSPKKRPEGQQNQLVRIPGQAIAGAGDVAMIKPPKKYTVKATIIKGQRSNLPPGTFIASGKGGSTLPFQRTTEAREPIEAVRTLSVPQMIDGRAKETIRETISEKLGARFQHHVEQAMK